MIMRHFQLSLFILLSLTAFSQEYDPYLEKIQNSKAVRTLKDSLLVNEINQTSRDSSYANAKKAELYARVAIKIASGIEYYKGQVDGYLTLGITKIYQNDFDSALICANKGLKIAKQYHFDLLVVQGKRI